MFYVYIYLFDGLPRYVGKGQGNRWKFHRRANSKLGNLIRKVQTETHRWPVPILINFETEKDAFLAEIELIKFYGRLHLGDGTLLNLTAGGLGFKSWHSNKSKIKISEALSRHDVKAKHSLATKAGMRIPANWQKFITNNAISKRTSEYRTKRSVISKSLMTPELKAKIREKVRAASSSEEYRLMISTKTRRALQDKGIRKKMSDAAVRRMSNSENRNRLAEIMKSKTSEERSKISRRYSDEQIVEAYYMPGLHREVSAKTGISTSHVGAIKRLSREVYKSILETYERKQNGTTISINI